MSSLQKELTKQLQGAVRELLDEHRWEYDIGRTPYVEYRIDYRQLNRVTVLDSSPLPLIDNCLNALQGSSWFSTLDL